jgi:hypothetical protein
MKEGKINTNHRSLWKLKKRQLVWVLFLAYTYPNNF